MRFDRLDQDTMARRADALFDCRWKVIQAQRYEERLMSASTDGLHSPGFDGASRGKGGHSDGAAARATALAALRERAAQARKDAEAAQRKARRWIRDLPASKALFAEAYYVMAMTLQEAADYCERSSRQCERYRSDLFGPEWMNGEFVEEP